MKYLAFIMAFIILGLSIIPCTDGIGTCSHEHSNEYSDISLNNNHDHSSDEQDHCTPFCVCACCGTTFTIPIGISLLSSWRHISIFQRQQPFFKSIYSFQFFNSIWHPPSTC